LRNRLRRLHFLGRRGSLGLVRAVQVRRLCFGVNGRIGRNLGEKSTGG
jgi:hypothetical protein